MKTICSRGIVNQGHHDSRQHFGTEEKYGSFDYPNPIGKIPMWPFGTKECFPTISLKFPWIGPL
jgi:hypothetical protein